jgi:hypothetical protein
MLLYLALIASRDSQRYELETQENAFQTLLGRSGTVTGDYPLSRFKLGLRSPFYEGQQVYKGVLGSFVSASLTHPPALQPPSISSITLLYS